MKLKILLACIVCFIFENSHADPLGTAFTYQGQLIANGLPANGTYDFIFALYNSASSGSEIGTPVVTNGLSVSNGLFTTSIDFGTQFNGTATWLAISVRTNNNPSGYNLLTPRQPLTPAPNALFASTSANATTASSVVNGVITTGTYADPAWITSLAGSKITGNIGGNAANITGMLPASQLSGAIPTTQLSGTLSNGQLANSSVTVSAGAGLSGGGSVSLGGTTTVSANLNHDATLTGNGGTANLGLNLGNANTWTASQTMNGGLQVTGVIFATELAIGGAGTLSGSPDPGTRRGCDVG